MINYSKTLQTIHKTGEPDREISISIAARFLELFSENLYKSPNKAFEELVANSWDAEATAVYISIPDDLAASEAAIWVLDNGVSMDTDGLETLWKIASDHKRSESPTRTRPQIGKFGIGKLSTYILASEITFICKAYDGKIRTVPLNYQNIEQSPGVWESRNICLPVRKISEADLRQILSTVQGSDRILELIADGVPHQESSLQEDEFHHTSELNIVPSGTWTLVLLSSLREMGQNIQKGRIRHMLRSALPLSSKISICLNNEPLTSAKIGANIKKCWILGKDLDIKEIDDDQGNGVTITKNDNDQFPFIEVEGIKGKISGQVVLYDSRISGGKSESIGLSNGFFINIRGRVINLENSDFGLENRSHSTWSQFRATIRADGLDDDLGVERDGLRDSPQTKLFKNLLWSFFNKARTALGKAEAAEWPNAGDILEGSWKTVPLKPLVEVVSERLTYEDSLPASIDRGSNEEFAEVRQQWLESVENNPSSLLSKVRSIPLDRKLPFSKYCLKTRELLINANHPFFVEQGSTVEERQILQNFALANFLTELYLIRNNVDSVVLDEGRVFRDEFLRLLAQLERKTGPQIACMLLEAGSHPKGLEVIVGDALNYLGFNIKPLGDKGEPDGTAQAPLTLQDASVPSPSAYKFTYDAKSTKHSRVTNRHVNPGTLARHRNKYEAEFALVVAPDFELGALQDECRNYRVTPMRTADLAELLIVSAASGTMDFSNFKNIFDLHDPDRVHDWIKDFIAQSNQQPHISVGALLKAFDGLSINGPDELETSVVAHHMRQVSNNEKFPTERHVRKAVEGLGVFLPAIVRNSNKTIYLSASPQDIKRALSEQLQMLPVQITQAFTWELEQER